MKRGADPFLCNSSNGDECLFRGHLTRAECADDLLCGAERWRDPSYGRWVTTAVCEVVVEHVYARALPPPAGFSAWYAWPVPRRRGAFPATVARRSFAGESCDLDVEARS